MSHRYILSQTQRLVQRCEQYPTVTPRTRYSHSGMKAICTNSELRNLRGLPRMHWHESCVAHNLVSPQKRLTNQGPSRQQLQLSASSTLPRTNPVSLSTSRKLLHRESARVEIQYAHHINLACSADLGEPCRLFRVLTLQAISEPGTCCNRRSGCAKMWHVRVSLRMLRLESGQDMAKN